jgi:hypothetical protein
VQFALVNVSGNIVVVPHGSTLVAHGSTLVAITSAIVITTDSWKKGARDDVTGDLDNDFGVISVGLRSKEFDIGIVGVPRNDNNASVAYQRLGSKGSSTKFSTTK